MISMIKCGVSSCKRGSIKKKLSCWDRVTIPSLSDLAFQRFPHSKLTCLPFLPLLHDEGAVSAEKLNPRRGHPAGALRVASSSC